MTVPASHVSEDLVLNGGKKRRHILPFVMVLLAILAVAGGIVSYFLIKNNSQNSTETPLVAFNNFREYLEKGPDEYRSRDEEISNGEGTDETSESTWFLLSLPEMDLPIANQKDYIAELSELYSIFTTATNEYNLNEAIQQEIVNYTRTLNDTIRLVNINVLANDLLQIYLVDGSEAAFEFIKTTVEQNENTESQNAISSSLTNYLKTQLSILEIYDAHSCLKDGLLDQECEASLADYGQSYNAVLRNQDAILRRIRQLLQILGPQLETQTNQLQNLIKERYE